MTLSNLIRRALFVLTATIIGATTLGVSALPAAAANAFVGTATKSTADGYWTTTAEGAVANHGTARSFGDLSGQHLNQPIVGIAATPNGEGYWLVARDGGIFSFGNAGFFGSTGSIHLNQPIVGMAATPTGAGYWMVASDGGIFAFGDARFFGSTGSIRLNQPIVAMSPTTSGSGYWLVATDGGVFAFGDAGFYGSTGSIRLNQPIVGMAASPAGAGYWMVARDGGVFAFGDAPFQGAASGGSFFGMTVDASGAYNLLGNDGSVQRKPRSNNATPAPVVVTPPAATAPSSPAPAPVATSPSGNLLASRALWVDPYNPARNQANAWRSTRPGDAAYMDRMGDSSDATWIGGWSGDVQSAVRNITTSAAQTNSVPVLVAYNIPSRDCGQWSAGGAAHAADYQAWIRGFAAGIESRPAAVILEPDALAGLDCLDGAGQQSRIGLLADAVNVLSSLPNTAVYLDAGNAYWQSPATIANRLRAANVAKARGFSINVSNFITTAQNVSYGDQIVAALGGGHYVIDTSRNGNGGTGEWCNPMGRALGQTPTTNTGNANVDAYLWLKRPGESDGGCNGGPNAGEWWGDYALGLAKAAWG